MIWGQRADTTRVVFENEYYPSSDQMIENISDVYKRHCWMFLKNLLEKKKINLNLQLYESKCMSISKGH